MTQLPRTTASAPQPAPEFAVGLAQTPDDIRAAQRLRYQVFVVEMRGNGPLVDHAGKTEEDTFDPVCDHLLLRDLARPSDNQVVGVYRLLRKDGAERAGGFYSEAEFDLGKLRQSGQRLLELGRSCLHPDYRGGSALRHLWQGVAAYVDKHQIGILFGTASFPGTDPVRWQSHLSWLHHTHLAPDHLRVTTRFPVDVPLIPAAKIDRLATARDTPALIKAYLRLGGVIGQGAYVDAAFNTVDVCMILDTRTAKTDTTRLRAQVTRPA